MSIIFGGDIGIQQDAMGNFWDSITSEASRIADGFAGRLSTTKKPPPKENIYVDDGFMNVPGTAVVGSGIENLDDAKRRRITTQKPDVTVYIKKKLFWSLRNEHDTKFADDGEKLFIRASKLLFERKCSQITAYESITKLSRILDEEADLDASGIDMIADHLDGIVTTVTENVIEPLDNAMITGDSDIIKELDKQLQQIKSNAVNVDKTVQSLRKLAGNARKTYSSLTTNWVVDPQRNVDVAKTGRGVGVIELTMTESVNTSLGLEYGDMGSISLSVEDPYNLMKISSHDVELALQAAHKELDDKNFNVSSTSADFLLSEARKKDNELRRRRESRLSYMFGNPSSIVGAGVGEISFEINISSNASHNVTGSISSLPDQFHSDNYNLILLQLPTEERLTVAETNLVKEIFDLLEQYANEMVRISENDAIQNEDETVKYARRQLRLFYVGKNIVQPMDGIHVYVRGRTFKDSAMLGPLNALINGSPFVQSFAYDAEANDAVLQEEMRQFGLEDSGIPLSLYRALRTSSLLRNAGTHVFGGLVSTVSESYNANSGKYILNINGESNMKWLKLSKVNTAPSLDQPQGILEDPLTPLELKIDEATGLLIGDPPSLSPDNKRRKLYFNEGERIGEEVDENSIKQDIIIYGSRAYDKLMHAPGLVYKWKQGVITATRNINLRTQLGGSGSEIAKLRRDVGVTITTDPFANLDIADVISLLVTGFPHNYESFFLNTQSIGTFVSGDYTNSPENYFHSFFDITRSTNRALGNFQPFKETHISPKQRAERLKLQSDLTKENNKIKDLQSQIATLQDQLNVLNMYNLEANSADRTELGSVNRLAVPKDLQVWLESLTAKLEEESEAFTKKIKQGEEKGLRVYGDDIIFEFTDETGGSETEETEKAVSRLKARSKLMKIRHQLNTKFNSDDNLFIVSDEYDKDLDLQGFAISLASGELPIWNSSYKVPFEICVNAAKVIDFEFFCNTMGHLEFRAPKYNKMPLSLIVKMMLLSEKGKDIFPPFLKALFASRKTSLEKTKEILDTEIELNSWLLFGRKLSDDELFGTRPGTADLFLQSLVTVASSSASTKDTIDNVRRLKNKLTIDAGTTPVSDTDEENKKIAEEIDALQDPSSPGVNALRLQKFNKLLQLSSRKQRVEQTLQKVTDRSNDDISWNNLLEESREGEGQRLLPGEMAYLLEPFGDMIEDDYNDFLGPGSAQRFIIYDDQIISYDFRESDANVYCRVDVTGQEDILGGKPGDIGGIPIIWAGATDFDLWKQYGWRAGDSINKPFFKDAENQCAPYALMLLSRQRRDAVRGSITLIGNEYYQLGDVVYINSRDMLYYVYGVRHSFSYSGGTFTTTLDLRYGHPLGEFIPTPLDVIGKNLIKNQRKFNTTFMHRRTASKEMGRLLGAIYFSNPNNISAEDLRKQMLTGDFGAVTLEELKRCLSRINSQISIGKDFNVEIRGYVFSDDQTEKDKVTNRMIAVQKWLESPISGFTTGSSPEEIALDERYYKPIGHDIINPADADTENNPINLETLTEYNKLNGRIPREETWNKSNKETEINTIEVIMVFPEE